MSIYKLDGFLNPEECRMYREQIQNEENCVAFTDSGKFKNNKYKDLQLATQFYTKMLTYGIKDNLLRPNDLIMTGMYSPGDSFGLHTDTGLYYNEVLKEKTQWTLLVYLNTLENEGATVFYDDKWCITETIYPKEGTAILFDINLWHKGEPIFKNKKFWIGCEIIGSF